MQALPWLVVHGVAVWRVALVTLVAGGAAIAWRRPRALARRAARLSCADLGWPIDLSRARDGARATLAGELDLHGEHPLLRIGRASVRLNGPMTVLSGSREEWPGAKAESRSLSSGDRVRIVGTLREEPGDEATSYRDAGKRWSLDGTLVASFDGAPSVVGPHPSVTLMAASVGATLFLLVFGLGARIAASEGLRGLIEQDIHPGRGEPLTIKLAAASPFTRHDALEMWAQVLDARQTPDPAELALREELHRSLGEDAEVAEMWIAHGEPAKGAALAAELGKNALAARGYYAAGDFERAAEVWDVDDDSERELRFGIGVNILAHHYTEASRIARALATRLDAHPLRRPDDHSDWYVNRAEMASCLVTALEARGGDDAAMRSLLDQYGTSRRREPQVRTGPRACWLLAMDLLDGQTRLDAIAALPWDRLEHDPYDVPMAWFRLLEAEASDRAVGGLSRPFANAAEVLVIPNGGDVARALPAVERELAERFATAHHGLSQVGDPTTESTATSAAVFALLAGDAASARRLARRADPAAAAAIALPQDATMADRELVRPAHLDTLSAAEKQRALRELAFQQGFLHGLRDFVVEHNASELVRSLTYEPPPDERERQAWFLAAGGDGVRLADWLRSPTSQPGTFLRYGAPLLATGRREVASWVRWGHRPVTSFHPVEELIHLATLADAAAALDDPDAAETLRQRTRFFREAVLTRETSVVLAVLDRL